MSLLPLRQSAARSARYVVGNYQVSTPLTSITPLFHRAYASDTSNNEPPPADQPSNNKKKSDSSTPPTTDNNENANGTTESPPPNPPPPNPQEELKKQLAVKDHELAQLQDAYLRCIADQENIRERTRKELASAKDYAIQSFAKDLLDTVDILNMALTSVPEEFHTKATAEATVAGSKDDTAVSMADHLSNLYTGVSLTEVELVKTLKRHGVERHDPQGEVFDPNLHQALFQAPVPDKLPGTIFSVQKLGYTLKGRVLRPAQVGVVAESE